MLPISFFPSNLSRYRLNKFKILFLSKIPVENFSLSPLFFFHPNFLDNIYTLSIRIRRSLHDHPSKRGIIRYDAPNDILCSNNSRVFHGLAGELA